jgi:KilA-N domain
MTAKDKASQREKEGYKRVKDVGKTLDIVKYKGFRFEFTNDQLVSLTVLWKQMGALPKKKPALWLRTELAKEFMLHLQEEAGGAAKPLLRIQREHSRCTFGHWKLALAYTAFLSPKIRAAFVSVARNRFELEDDFDKDIQYYTQAGDNSELIRKN